MDITNAVVSTRCPNLTCNRDMEQVKPGTAEQKFCGTWLRCPRCHSAVLLPSAELEAQLASQRVKAAKGAAQRDPMVKAAFAAWVANEAYWDGGGYRLTTDKRRRAVWSKAIVALYPNTSDFHEAARAVFGAREDAKEAHDSRVTPSAPEPVTELMRRREAEVRAGLLFSA